MTTILDIVNRMGWGWRRAAALGLGAVVLLGVAGTLLRPAAAVAASTDDEFLQAQGRARAEKVKAAAQAAIALGAAAMGVKSDGDADGAGAASLVSGRTLLLPSEGAPLPSWTAVAAIAPLGAMAALMLFLRPLPTLHLAGSLFRVATTRGPPPPMMSAFLRMAAIGLMGVALVSPLLFEPMLVASTSLLLVSLVTTPVPA